MNWQASRSLTRTLSSLRSLPLRRITGPMIEFVPVAASNRPAVFSAEGLRERKYRVVQLFRNLVGALLMYKDMNNFGIAALKGELWGLYKQFSTAIDSHDSRKLKKICTESLYQTLSPFFLQVKSASKVDQSLDLKCAPTLIYLTPIDFRGEVQKRIFQVTVEFKYTYSAAKSEHPTVDYAVFEYDPNVLHPKWRLCGRAHPSDRYFRNPSRAEPQQWT